MTSAQTSWGRTRDESVEAVPSNTAFTAPLDRIAVGGDVRRLVFDKSEFGALGNAWLQSLDAGLAIDRYEIHVGARSEEVTIGESHEESRSEMRASLSTHPSGVWL
jgi:hypothetical protein